MKGVPETEHWHQWFMRFAIVADGRPPTGRPPPRRRFLAAPGAVAAV